MHDTLKLVLAGAIQQLGLLDRNGGRFGGILKLAGLYHQNKSLEHGNK